MNKFKDGHKIHHQSHKAKRRRSFGSWAPSLCFSCFLKGVPSLLKMDLRWAAGCFSWTFCWMRCSLAVKFQKRHGMFLKHIFRESSFRQSQPSTYIVWDIIRTPEMSTANNYCLLDQSVQSTKTCKHDMIIRFYAVMQGYDSLCNCPVFQVVGLVLLVSESTLQHNVRKIRRNGEGMTCISQLPMAWITAKMPSSKSEFSIFLVAILNDDDDLKSDSPSLWPLLRMFKRNF